MPKVDNRQVKVSRGRFLGGSSGVNGTLCIRGTKQDYDDWGLDEWTGDKMFEYMKKVGCAFSEMLSMKSDSETVRDFPREGLAQS
jgi:choline dehydrogenase-like flavoprotein